MNSITILLATLLTLAGTLAEYKPMGCFYDLPASHIYSVFRPKNTNYGGGMTLEKCSDHCRDNGFVYGAAFNGVYCRCGFAVFDRFGRPSNSSECNVPCRGNKNETCGGKRVGTYDRVTVIMTDHPCGRRSTNKCMGLEAKCIPNKANYTCSCPPGYSGDNCQYGVCSVTACGPSKSYLCSASGTGVNATYTCGCKPGYMKTSDDPECKLQDSCASTPCLNNGECFSRENGFFCVCPTGYYGARCSSKKECKDIKCFNGGNCTMADGFATCQCDDTVSKGEFCQTLNEKIVDEDLCFHVSCQGSNCLDRATKQTHSYCVKPKDGFCAVSTLTESATATTVASCAMECEEGSTMQVVYNKQALKSTVKKCCKIDRCNYSSDLSIGALASGAATPVSSILSLTALSAFGAYVLA